MIITKRIIYIISFVFLYLFEVAGQEVSVELKIFGYQHEYRTTVHSNKSISGAGYAGINFSDTLVGNWDYKLGFGTFQTNENYYSRVKITEESFDTSRFYFLSIGDFFRNEYLSISVGTTFWLLNKRKGLNVTSELKPHILINSDRTVRQLDFNGKSTYTIIDGSNSYLSFNMIWMTSLGYRLIVYKGLSIFASYNLLLRIGNVVKGVGDSFRFNRGITLGGTYKF